MMSAPLRIGIVGFGHWGPNHLRVFSAIGDCRVIAVADQSEPRLLAAREMAPDARGFADYRALLREADVDAVVVATPTRTHYAITSDALDAGKHVLCEKPLCTDAAEGER